MIEVLTPGLLSSLQDRGRPGLAHLGIGRAGAADLPALRLANALVGNPPDACAMEITLTGPALRLHRDVEIALTGAPVAAEANGRPLPGWTPLRLRAGSVLRLGGMRHGCRSYLAVRGGIDVAAVLGSRSQDLNAGLGPLDGRPLRAGDRLPLGPPDDTTGAADRAAWSLDPRPWFDGAAARTLRLLAGTHTTLLDAASREALFAAGFRVAAASNRVGCRLDGPRLALHAPLELISEGVIAGTVQLPPNGQPIVLFCEHPVSGGYPRIGQLAAVDLPRLAQRRPGDTLRFAPIDAGEAARLLEAREQRLLRMETAIARRRAAS